MTDKQTLSIDGKQYDIDSLSKEARDHAVQTRAAEAEIAALKMRLVITETARRVFLDALRRSLPAT